jgi:hypothetical protein
MMLCWAAQVDYAAAGIFLNISSNGGKGSAPWWTRPDVQVAPGIEALVPVSPTSFLFPQGQATLRSSLAPWAACLHAQHDACTMHIVNTRREPFLAAQVYDRFSPAWWFADVPIEAIAPLSSLDSVLPFLKQVHHPFQIPSPCGPPCLAPAVYHAWASPHAARLHQAAACRRDLEVGMHAGNMLPLMHATW